MQLNLLSIIALATASAYASPVADAQELARRQTQSITLTFQGGPASFTQTIPATGQLVNIANRLSVSRVSSPGANVFGRCAFQTVNNARLTRVGNSDGSVTIGPPQTLTAVSCLPDFAQCLPNFADCEFTLPSGGITIGNCCSGYCAATKCRPTS